MNDEKFWELIKLINWGEICKSTDRINTAKRRYMEFIEDPNDRTQFETIFRQYFTQINEETYQRRSNNKKVFAPGVSYGADDCHFMDMPSHLIGLGKKQMQQYLNGGLIPFEPVECLLYIFNPDEE